MNLSYLDEIALATYSAKERQSLYQMVCGMMIIDGYSDPREKIVIEDIVLALHLTSEERASSRNIPVEVQLSTLKNMDVMKKCYVAKFLAQVALADGVVSQKEQLFFDYYTKVLGLPSDPNSL